MKEVPLTNSHLTGIVNNKDFPAVMKRRWMAVPKNRNVYIVSTDSKVYLHRFLIRCKKEVDHRNGDGLDNRRRNLRPATKRQQQWNRTTNINSPKKTSRFKGVCFRPDSPNCWRADIFARGRHFGLGSFAIEEDAARAYDKAAIKYFKDFARLNFPRSL